MGTSAFSFALNSFFRKRRNRAMGIAATLTGIGPIVVPQLTSVLLEKYGSQGCVLILSAICLHIIAAGLLLQPIKWHLVDAPAVAPVNQQTAIEVEMRPMTTTIIPEEEEQQESVRGKESDSEPQMTIVTVPEEPLSGSRDHGGFSDFSSEDEEDYMDLHIRRLSIEHEIETQSIYGLDIVPAGSILRLNSHHDQHIANFQSKQDLTFQRQYSQDPAAVRNLRYRRQSSTISNRSQVRPSYMRSLSNLPPPKPKRWFEESQETINLGSSMNIFNEKTPDERKVMIREPNKYSGFPAGSVKITEEANKMEERPSQVPPKSALKHTYSSVPSSATERHESEDIDKRTVSFQMRKILKCIVDTFDLNLLRDPIYLNLMLGMSIAIFAEINFSLLTPFFLNDMGYNTDQIASVMSALALSDLIFRFLAPYIGEILKQPPRIMYMISLVLLIITRSFVYMVGTYTGMLIVGILLGIAKGIRTVYMSLVIPDYIPIERLASASGIQMVTNGVILMGAGPLLGWIRDVTGSYLKCIIIINLVTLCAVLMWTAEIVYRKHRTNKKT